METTEEDLKQLSGNYLVTYEYFKQHGDLLVKNTDQIKLTGYTKKEVKEEVYRICKNVVITDIKPMDTIDDKVNEK